MKPPPGERDDAALVADALAGEDRAFTELMRRYKEMVYRFVRRYVGDADEAYDLVQETFVAAWSALEGFDASRPMSAWLRRIALNKCRDWSRRRQVRRFFFWAENLDVAAAEIESAQHTTAPARNEDDLARLDAAVSVLPAAIKEPFLLTYFEGMSQKEAALALGISVKAVETRVRRARQTLMRRLREDN